MNSYEHPLNPLENASLRTEALDGLPWDYSVMRGYVWVYVGMRFAFAPLALLTAFSMGERGEGVKGTYACRVFTLLTIACHHSSKTWSEMASDSPLAEWRSQKAFKLLANPEAELPKLLTSRGKNSGRPAFEDQPLDAETAAALGQLLDDRSTAVAVRVLALGVITVDGDGTYEMLKADVGGAGTEEPVLDRLVGWTRGGENDAAELRQMKEMVGQTLMEVADDADGAAALLAAHGAMAWVLTTIKEEVLAWQSRPAGGEKEETQEEEEEALLDHVLGALYNCTFHSEATRLPALAAARAAGLLEPAVLPALMDRDDAIGFTALQIVANLVGREEDASSALLSARPQSIELILNLLRRTLAGESNTPDTLGFSWSTYELVICVVNLSIADANKPQLAAAGVVALCLQILAEVRCSSCCAWLRRPSLQLRYP